MSKRIEFLSVVVLQGRIKARRQMGPARPWPLFRPLRPICQVLRASFSRPKRDQLWGANKVPGSIFTPGPMVEEMATRLMK